MNPLQKFLNVFTTVFDSFRRRAIKILSKGLEHEAQYNIRHPKREPEVLESLVEGMKAPGLPCPNCQYKIPMQLQDLIADKPIVCPICQLKLFVDRKSSKTTVEVVKKVLKAKDGLEKHKTFLY